MVGEDCVLDVTKTQIIKMPLKTFHLDHFTRAIILKNNFINGEKIQTEI